MSDDWQKGDLALCVNDSPSRAPYFVRRGVAFPLRAGTVLTVHGIALAENGDAGLLFEHVCAGHYAGGTEIVFHPRRFRKIHPLNEAERDAALRELNAPVREPVL